MVSQEHMSRWFLITLTLVLVGTARAEPPALLGDAIKKWIADEDHWAYTQRQRVRDRTKPVVERVERYDPSQPDDQQWQLLEIDGKAPTADEIAAWRRRKGKEVKRRNERPLADYFDFDHATVAGETAESVRYDVPLHKEAYRRVPLDKIQVSVTVNKARRELESLAAGLKDPFRMALGAAKVTDFGLDIHFRTIDAKYASQPDLIKASGSARVVFFFKISGDAEMTWSDFKRVKPFKERFDVKIGDLKALDF